MSPASSASLLFPVLCLAIPLAWAAGTKTRPVWGAALSATMLLLGFGLFYLSGSIQISQLVEGLATGAAVFFAGVVPVVFGLMRPGELKVISALAVWAGPGGMAVLLLGALAVMAVMRATGAGWGRIATEGARAMARV